MDRRANRAADNKPLTCELKGHSIIIDDDLQISFRRTIRVPDNAQTSFLPPDLGAFPLEPVSRYADKMCAGMVAKSGLFFPMYRK
tara:strand:+ start:513 stop:767 length:255 start_codon:yes stop_codon:yes gene_type:complete